MTSTLPLILHTVDFTPPFAEDAFSKDMIRKFALEIQETELRFLNLVWRAVASLMLRYRFGKLRPKTSVLLP
ncbi:MAG TPA: hypothetical protein VEG61_03030 [Candidatus Dormibacteraeota bacterium]|jgi:hypothetical protein|nr:hypothetical protein [Candidatus Dormibacteraeota bacterium]